MRAVTTYKECFAEGKSCYSGATASNSPECIKLTLHNRVW